MREVKVGVVGCGYMSQLAHIPSLLAAEGSKVAALCDFREDLARELCRRHDIPRAVNNVETLLELDLDAVFVLTPVQCHYGLIQAAARSGKRVFTE